MEWLTNIESIMSEAVWQQVVVLAILGVGLILFVKDRWRYDVVALLIMIAVVATGVLSYEEALANFGHPAVIIVASMFVMSRALVQSGLVDATIGRMSFLHQRPILSLGILVVLVAVLSAFINNVGALAMVMPMAIHLARKSGTSIALFLLPLAFASHLGGFMTLIGTPRNLLISDFRFQVTGEGFAMFDFLPVGGMLAIVGVIFLVGIAWRLLPRKTDESVSDERYRTYATEVVVPEKTRLIKYPVAKLKKLNQNSVTFIRLLRDNAEFEITDSTEFLPGDHIIIQADAGTLTQFIEKYNLVLSGLRALEWHVTSADDHTTVEAIVPPYANLIGRSWDTVALQKRFGTNFIAIARRGYTSGWPLESIVLRAGDIILLRGRLESVKDTMRSLRLIPIDSMNQDEITLGRPRTALATTLILAITVTLATMNMVPLAFVFLSAAVLLVVLDFISLRQAYESIDPSVLIMLAGMLTLGAALQASGAAESLAQLFLLLGEFVGPVTLLTLVLFGSMFLSDFMNATASVAVMGPTAILVASSLAVSIDPFLMVVAVGASCAFLTPVGHESNAIVMKKGGYNFSDYFKIGFPLELIIAIVTIPAVLYFWPLH